MKHKSLLDSLKEFEKLSSGNKYADIQKLCKRSRNLGHAYPGTRDSTSLSCALYNEIPDHIKKSKISSELSRYDEIIAHVSDPKIIESVNLSLKYSTKDNIQYVYSENLDNVDILRVQTIVKMILDI